MASRFVFSEYTETELVECGKAFLASCRKHWDEDDTEWWTEFVLNWFCETAPEDVCVDARTSRTTGPRARKTIGEWMVDLAHSTYPLRGEERYWNAAMKSDSDRSWSILLALESEWGKGRAKSATRDMVLDDASKLTALRAKVKVLITGAPTAHASALEQDLRTLRTCTRDLSPWLWVNLPNEDTSDNCRYVMFGQRRGTVPRPPH